MESLRERIEGPFKSALTIFDSITSENEAKRVKLRQEFDQKNQIFEEHLQRLIEQ